MQVDILDTLGLCGPTQVKFVNDHVVPLLAYLEELLIDLLCHCRGLLLDRPFSGPNSHFHPISTPGVS